MVMAKIKENRLVLVTGGLFLLLAVGHIPTPILTSFFDKAIAVHFFDLLVASTIFSIIILKRSSRFISDYRVWGALWLIVIAEIISALLSVAPLLSFIGDSGRFVGVISLICLLVVAIYHGQFSWEQIRKLFWIYEGVVALVALLGVLQHFSILSFPGDVGVISTLGNMDFYAAFIGTSLPLIFFLAIESTLKERIALGALTIPGIAGLYFAGRRQAWVDIALLIIGFGIFSIRKYIPRRDLTLNVRSAFFSLGLLIWIEGIFLMPFLGKFVPVLGSDIQVKIRGQFWIAALNQFFAKPFFGVGPDQYGNYYELHRNVDSIKDTFNVVTNDAHGSNVQTLATVGIVGTALFALLLIILIRSLIILWDRNQVNRKLVFALGVYFFIFLTNSAVSPITLPNKFLFWGTAGFVIGKAYLKPNDVGDEIPRPGFIKFLESSRGVKSFVGASLALIIFFGGQFVNAEVRFIAASEDHLANPTRKIDYEPSPYLSCWGYFDNALQIVQPKGAEELNRISLKEIEINPRCVSARLIVGQVAWMRNDMAELGRQVKALESIAPSRPDFLKMASAYSERVGDKVLARKIYIQMVKVGMIQIINHKKSAK